MLISIDLPVAVAQPRKLTFLYLANDVIQNSKKKGPEFSQEFEGNSSALVYWIANMLFIGSAESKTEIYVNSI